MKKIAIILYILTSILFASEEELEHKEVLKLSNEIINSLSKTLQDKGKGVQFLLLNEDINTTIFVLTSYNKKYKDFKNRKKNLKDNISVKRLSDLYINILEEDTDIKFTDITQYLYRLSYESYILYHLKKDLNKNNIDAKDKIKLLRHIEKLLLLDTQSVYELVRAHNEFYARNMKKYINIMRNEPRKNIIYNNETYEKFLFYLNRNERLLFKGIESNEPKLFTEFNKEELATIRAYISSLNNVSDNFIYTDYWIRSQIYIRYYTEANNCFYLVNSIEKQRTLFYDLFPVDSE